MDCANRHTCCLIHIVFKMNKFFFRFFSLLFFSAALLLSSSSFADYYSARANTSSSFTFYGCDAYTACNNLTNGTPSLMNGSGIPSGSQCSYQFTSGSPDSGPLLRHSGQPNTNQIPGGCPTSCPAGEEFDEYNKCVPIGCPDGQFFENGACQHGCVSGAEVKLVLPIEQVQSFTIDPILGCDLQIKSGKSPECNFNTLLCNVYYEDQGTYNENFSYDNGQPPEPLPEPEPSPEPVTTEDVVGPVIETVNNPDGSTTTTETTTTTQTNDLGYEVEIIGDSIVLKNQAGEIVEILQQYEINSYTDGTSEIIETTTTTATPNSITEVKKNLTDGSTSTTTRTYQSGRSGTITTTKTTTYDSTGNPTGSTTTTSGNISESDGSGEGEGEGGAFCDYADIVCDFIEWFREPSEEPEVPEMPVEELALEDVQSEWTSGLGSGSCPANPQANLNGTIIEYDMAVYCQVATDVVYWLLIFAATIGGGLIIAGIRS